MRDVLDVLVRLVKGLLMVLLWKFCEFDRIYVTVGMTVVGCLVVTLLGIVMRLGWLLLMAWSYYPVQPHSLKYL